MENFVLYEEVGRGDNSIVYKGRRKGTIHFVAIHCIDKCKRAQITNLVRLTHEIEHHNSVKFYEWYETTNHLWLVVELCTGGSLETVITQDDHLPESAIRKFGVDLVQGLHHIHSLGIIFCDIKPSKILLDGPGVMKFADFGLSCVEGENLEELFEQFADVGENWGDGGENGEGNKSCGSKGSTTYMAPELIQGAMPSVTSDLWSLGCVIYEMYTGHPPFLADSEQQLKDKIIHKDMPPPRVRGARVTGKPSPEFQLLIEELLEKDPHKRMTWEGIVMHSFWQGALQHLAKDIDSAESQDLRQSVRQSIANFSARASVTCELPKGNSVLGHIHDVDLKDDHLDAGIVSEKTEDFSNLLATERPDTASTLRPLTAPGTGDGRVAFTISCSKNSFCFDDDTTISPDDIYPSDADGISRPHTAVTNDAVPDEHLSATSPQRLLLQAPVSSKEATRKAKADPGDEMTQLIYHTSDFTVTPIVDNPKIQKPGTYKFDPKTLPVPPHTVDRIGSMSAKDQDKHFGVIIEAVTMAEKGPLSQKRMHLMNYIVTITAHSQVANALVGHGLLGALSRHIKEASQIETRGKLCRVLATLANSTTEVDPNTSLSEPMTILTEILRDGFRNTKVKAAILPALGEILFLIAAQEEIVGHSVDAWAVSSMTYTLVTRCLREGEESLVNHYAAKIVENLASTQGQHSLKFATNEVGFLLWYVFSHATADALRITALTALSRLTRHTVGIFQNVLEKVGLPRMLAAMALPVNRIQQAVLTLFASLTASDSRLNRLVTEKDFTLSVMRLLESTSLVIRGKAFLVVLAIIKANQEMSLICCQNRLVMYIERDGRRGQPGKVDHPGQMEYLNKCLERLINQLLEMVPCITKEILGCLEAVTGRKHPSTIQVKQLKSSLPLMPVVHHLICSQVFRHRVINEKFVRSLGTFLTHVKSIDSGQTQIQGATGPSGTAEFVHCVFAVVESLVPHPGLLTDYHSLMIDKVLPALAGLVGSSFGDTRAISLRLFSEIAAVYLNTEQFDTTQHRSQMKKLHMIISDTLLPQYEQLLLEQDPLPLHALKLLVALLEQNTAVIRDIERLGLVPVLFQVLIDHQSLPVSGTVQQVTAIFNVMVTRKETNMTELYEQGLVDHINSVFVGVSSTCINSDNNANTKDAINILLTLLDTIHTTLKYVSDVVRKALQAKKTGGDSGSKEAEMAEALLLTNKAFTDLVSIITQLLVHEDSDVADVALKCLSLLVQLFGGEHPDALTRDGMVYYSEALRKADAKKQKMILRIIKRMIMTEKSHCNMMKQHGAVLADTIKTLIHTASSHAEVAVSTVAMEILKATGHMT